jgi:hypothetical protein
MTLSSNHNQVLLQIFEDETTARKKKKLHPLKLKIKYRRNSFHGLATRLMYGFGRISDLQSHIFAVLVCLFISRDLNTLRGLRQKHKATAHGLVRFFSIHLLQKYLLAF